MALSGSFYGTQLSYQQLYFTWSATQNVGGNTSTITLNMYLKGSYTLNVSGRSDASVTIAGTGYGVSAPAISQSSSSGWQVLLGSASKTVSHNADGTLTTSLSGYYPIRATLSGTYYDSFSGSANITLDTIPRASTPTLSAGTTALGSAVTIYTNRASTGFTHTISYAYGNIGKTTIASSVADNTSWTLPNSLASETPSATGGTGTIYCDTYSGGSLIGTKTVSFSTSIPNSVTFQPTVGAVTPSETVAGVTALALGKYVQGLSNVSFSISGIAGVYGSTVSQAKITFNGTTYTATVSAGTATWTTGILAVSGTINYSVTVTDSRGYTDASPTTGSITVLPYSTPLITGFSAKRCDLNGNLNEIGTYLWIDRDGTASSLKDGSAVEKNTLACSVQWSIKGANSWTAMTECAVSASSTLAISTTGIKSTKTDFAITSAYDIKFTLTDKFNNTVSTIIVTVGSVMMSWGQKGVGIGKVITSASTNVLEVGGTMAVDNNILGYSGQMVYRGIDSWCRINDGGTPHSSGIYFGTSITRTDGEFQVGGNGAYFRVTSGGNMTVAGTTTLNGAVNINGAITFPSAVNAGSDYGYIQYDDDNNTYAYWGDSTENSALIIGVQNDGRVASSDVVAIKATAGVMMDAILMKFPQADSWIEFASGGSWLQGQSTGCVRVGSGNGYIDVGPQNASWCHMYTDRPAIIFNKDVYVTGGGYHFYDGGNASVIKANGSYNGIDIYGGQSYNFNSGNARGIWAIFDNAGVGSGGSEQTIRPSANAFGFLGTSGTKWYQVWSYSALQTSTREDKVEIINFDTEYAYDIIRDIKTYQYRHTDKNDLMLGVMMDEAPMEIVDHMTQKGINLYSWTTLTTSALQEAIKQIELLKEQIILLGGTI